MRYIVLLLAIVFSCNLFSATSANEKKAKLPEEEFKESKFIQIDEAIVPKELKTIEPQIIQSAIDVIILASNHTMIYSQTKEEGYNENYKKFYGLKIAITSPGETADFFNLKLHYYNWTTTTYDKHINKKIYKYNVLNELRFALYELFKGEKYVKDHREEIEKQNYNRIQSIRESVATQERIERKKEKLDRAKQAELDRLKEEKEETLLKREKKEKKESKEKKEEINEKEALSPKNTLSPSSNAPSINDPETSTQTTIENKKQKKVASSQKNNSKKKAATQYPPLEEQSPSLSSPPVNNIQVIPISSYSAMGGFKNTTIQSQGLVSTKTTINHLLIGGKYKQEKIEKHPRVLYFSLIAGMPINKQDFPIPIYRNLGFEIAKKKYLTYFSGHAGFEYTSLDFINLAQAGGRLQVIRNDLFLGKIGGEIEINWSNFQLNTRASLLKSLFVKSNFNKPINTSSLQYKISLAFARSHCIEATLQTTIFSGSYTGDSKSIQALYSYSFSD